MRTWGLVTTAALLTAAFILALVLPGVSADTANKVSNGGQLLAALLAALGCAVAARRSAGPRRLSWWWLSAGTGSWAAGQLVWSYYEIVLKQEVPFPAYSDIGFLLFPVASAVGLVIWLGTQTHELAARGRDLLDGMLIAWSLLTVSWVTALGSVVANHSSDLLRVTIAVAYPIGDLVLATLVFIALARDTERITLALLAVGLGGLAVSDSAYVFLTTTGTYSSVDLVTSGWVAGFLFVGVSAMTVRRTTARHVARRADPQAETPSLLHVGLPYLPMLAAAVALCGDVVHKQRTPLFDMILGLGLVGLVLSRQWLAILDNQRLLIALREARDQLQHQALHDALTGAANRVLFADRLDQALLRREADITVLYCDLDDFKHVNDQLGHAAGDAVLAVVAQRLQGCVRASDTVARLGGDEFAMLLESSQDTLQVADRVVAAMAEPVDMHGRLLTISLSIGIARYRQPTAAGQPDASGERELVAATLIKRADSAMYDAKGAGKGRAVISQEVAA